MNHLQPASEASVDDYIRWFRPRLPKRLENASLAHDYPRDKALEILSYFKKTGSGLYVCGDAGRGKSYLGAALVNHAWETHLAAFRRGEWTTPKTVPAFISIPELLTDLKAHFNQKDYESEWESPLDRVVERPSLIVLDDIGAGNMTPWAEDIIYHIVNTRWGEELPTVYTSNFTLNGLESVLSKRITSRINGCCKTIGLDGPDRRMVANSNT